MIPVNVPVNTYTGNSSATIFDFDFLIKKATELVVLHTDKDGIQVQLKQNIDYTINEVGNQNGSFINFPILGSSYEKLAEDETIILMLDLPIMQETPYGTSAKLDLKTLEYSLDYIVRCLQILDRKQERSVKVPEGSKQTADDLINALNDAQLSAKKSAEQAKSSASEAKENAEIVVNVKNEFVDLSDNCFEELEQKKEEAINNVIDTADSKNEEVISSGNAKIEEINNTIKNIEGAVISGRFIGELIPATFPLLMSDGTMPQTLKLTNGEIIPQNGKYEQAVKHIKMVASLYPKIVCSSDEYNNILSKYGECPKFVIDDNAQTLRLPTINSILQGVTSLADLATIVEAGLPNITGSVVNQWAWIDAHSYSGAFVGTNARAASGSGQSSNTLGSFDFNASLSNPIYGRCNTVQPQTVRAAYYIVMATGIEQNIKTISSIEVQDVYPLLYPLISDKLIYNSCFARSAGQYYSKLLYPQVWNYLLEKFNTGTAKEFSGIPYIEGTDKIKIVDVVNENKVQDLYNSTGSAWFYIIDVANGLFKFPILDKDKSNLFLYFKVGNAVQNIQLIDIAELQESINQILNSCPDKSLSNIDSNIDFVTYNYLNGGQCCRIYKSGFHLESNVIGSMGYDQVVTHNFVKPFKAAIAVSGATTYSQGNGNKRSSWRVYSLTNNYIQLQARFEQGVGAIWWQVFGYS